MYLAFVGFFLVSLMTVLTTWNASVNSNDLKTVVALVGWVCVLVGSAVFLYFNRGDWRKTQ